MPSRDFMVRQATLNALAGIYTSTIPLYGMANAARDALTELNNQDGFGDIITNRIRHHFRIIARRFEVVQ